MLTIRSSDSSSNISGVFLDFVSVNFTIGIEKENYSQLKVETLYDGQNVLCYHGLRATISAEEAQKIRNLINQ